MEVNGMPKKFWVVTKPSYASEMADICFACTFGGLMNQFRGGLHENEIVSIHADEGEARRAAARLLGKHPVRPGDTVFAEVIVNVMAQPLGEGLTARELGEAAVEAVLDAVQRAEKQGHHHRLQDRVALCASQAAELGNLQTMSRSSCK